jgi:hypothetical protein
MALVSKYHVAEKKMSKYDLETKSVGKNIVKF